MSWIKEFREFAMKGSVVDLAVGVVIGSAFGKIVSSLVANIVMPPLNLLTAKYGVNFTELALKVTTESPKLNPDGSVVKNEDGSIAMAMQDYPILNYGPFLQTVVDFLLIAMAIFVVVKMLNNAKRRFEKQEVTAPAEPSEDIKLLREIRDSLRR
ncbi:MAG: large-conductance mechanosensitive channel protein MscL [Pirellulaceae bacterium]|nr:large-conductance mechanosensitive channel protein MscL [Pirellulaceae bacterium]